MNKFTFNHKTGENPTWTNAEVELLVKQHNDFLFKEEIAPLKTELKATKKENGELTTKVEAADKAAEKATKDFDKKYEELEATLKPYKEAEVTTKRNEVAAKLVAKDKIQDAMKLAGIDAEDDIEAVEAKLKAFVETEGREDYKFVETPEGNDNDEFDAFAAIRSKPKTPESKIETIEDLGIDDEDQIDW